MSSRRDTARRTEGSLLAFVVLILLCGSLLVFLAKTRDGVPADALNLNTATADELSLALSLPSELAALRRMDGPISNVIDSGFPPLEEVEREHILKVLEASEGRKTDAAAILGIYRSTLWKKLRQYGVE